MAGLAPEPLPLCSRAFAMICWRDYAGARREFEKALEANPHDVQARWTLAELLGNQLHDDAAAREHALLGLQTDPWHRGCRRVLARLNGDPWDTDTPTEHAAAPKASALAALNANAFLADPAIPASRIAETIAGRHDDYRGLTTAAWGGGAASLSLESRSAALSESVVLQTLRALGDSRDPRTGLSTTWLA